MYFQTISWIEPLCSTICLIPICNSSLIFSLVFHIHPQQHYWSENQNPKTILTPSNCLADQPQTTVDLLFNHTKHEIYICFLAYRASCLHLFRPQCWRKLRVDEEWRNLTLHLRRFHTAPCPGNQKMGTVTKSQRAHRDQVVRPVLVFCFPVFSKNYKTHKQTL